MALLAVVCVATTAKACLNYLSEDFKSRGELESRTPKESRTRGIFVTALAAESNEVAIGNRPIRFSRAWIEERSLPAHQFIWLPGERRMAVGDCKSRWPQQTD